MKRILIADSSRMFADGLAKQLKQDYMLKLCYDGKHILRNIREFEPDIIFIDLSLSACDVITVLHTVRSSGSAAQIVAISVNTSIQVQQILVGIGVVRIFPRPCALENVVSFLHRIASDLPDLSLWRAETEIDSILLYMGFQCGRSRYNCIYNAILLKYCGRGGDSVKYLYSEVRKLCGKKSIEVVEKAIRDAIRHAWEHGDPDVWNMYFPTCDKDGCPSNEVFVGRIVLALKNCERLKKPYFNELTCHKFG